MTSTALHTIPHSPSFSADFLLWKTYSDGLNAAWRPGSWLHTKPLSVELWSVNRAVICPWCTASAPVRRQVQRESGGRAPGRPARTRRPSIVLCGGGSARGGGGPGCWLSSLHITLYPKMTWVSPFRFKTIYYVFFFTDLKCNCSNLSNLRRLKCGFSPPLPCRLWLVLVLRVDGWRVRAGILPTILTVRISSLVNKASFHCRKYLHLLSVISRM